MTARPLPEQYHVDSRSVVCPGLGRVKGWRVPRLARVVRLSAWLGRAEGCRVGVTRFMPSVRGTTIGSVTPIVGIPGSRFLNGNRNRGVDRPLRYFNADRDRGETFTAKIEVAQALSEAEPER